MKMKIIFIRIVLLLLLILGGYYLFFLAPKSALSNAYLKTQEVFAGRKTNLMENRLALVELASLSPNSPDLFNKETELLQKLQRTNETGIKSLEENDLSYIDGVPEEIGVALEILLQKERQILEEQQELIDSLINLIRQSGATPPEKVLSAQLALIRSNTSVELLTRQSNLILEYDFWLKKISSYQAKLFSTR